MQTFHISDLLSVTTRRHVSINGIKAIYAILSYLTKDTVYTHQTPRAMRETEAALKEQFPELFPGHPKMEAALAELDESLAGIADEARKQVCLDWIAYVCESFGLPEYVMIASPMAADHHERIDPVKELEQMIGKKPIVIQED